eukprot:GHVR01043063.1.p1 GENE.GHVR01043063.1~~GHVR01043063.1.p1  ORF type:complete len:580 (+),score=159.91 GHVR01043063.1:102-1841(+)
MDLPSSTTSQYITDDGVMLESDVSQLVIRLHMSLYDNFDSIAVVENDEIYTYGQLLHISDYVSNKLHSLGVQYADIVGINIPKSYYYIASMIGVTQMGAVWSPLDVKLKPFLIEKLRSVSRMAYVIDSVFFDEFILPPDPIVKVKSLWSSSVVDSDANFFLVYSSGTTGRPKGILSTHRSTTRAYEWRHSIETKEENKCVGCNVFFVWECLRPLLIGGSIVVIDDLTVIDPPILIDKLIKYKVSQMLFTPSLLRLILREIKELQLPHMKLIYICGEVIDESLRLLCIDKLPKYVKIMNLYSISEVPDIGVGDMRIGLGITNLFPHTHIRINEENLELSLCCRTAGPGYFQNKNANELAFIECATTGLIFYKTGDRINFCISGGFNIVGRVDLMVKIRGYSVQVDTLETTIAEILGVMDNQYVLKLERLEVGDQLVMYCREDTSLDPTEIRKILSEHIPDYMLPHQVVVQQKRKTLGHGIDAVSCKKDRCLLTHTQRLVRDSVELIINNNIIDNDINISFFLLGLQSLQIFKLIRNIVNIFQQTDTHTQIDNNIDDNTHIHTHTHTHIKRFFDDASINFK